jgi:hypothetical protein
MSTVSIHNAMPKGIRLRLFGQINDPGGHRDFATLQTRGIPVGSINDIELPGRGAVTTLNAGFWSSWLAQNSAAEFVCRHLVYPVG